MFNPLKYVTLKTKKVRKIPITVADLWSVSKCIERNMKNKDWHRVPSENASKYLPLWLDQYNQENIS